MRLCQCVTVFVQRLGCEYERFRHTGWSTKEAGMYLHPAFIYLFYLLLFFFILLECLWSSKILRIEGQLAFTKPHLFGQFIFHQEPVLDQTMTNLQQNTIGLKFLDFNHILF